MLGPALADVGITPPLPANVRAFPLGDRNTDGLTVAGEVALLEAMRLGMVIDMDHMSERSSTKAHEIATKQVAVGPYPLVAAHNGARKLAPRPLDATQPAQVDHRRNHETWPSESMKSETQLGWIKETGGIFGHGIAGADSIGFGSVPNDCVGSSKTFAQGISTSPRGSRCRSRLGTDWNALLAGPGPRFGPQAANGLEGELEQGDAAWQARVIAERAMNAAAQTDGVVLRDADPRLARLPLPGVGPVRRRQPPDVAGPRAGRVGRRPDGAGGDGGAGAPGHDRGDALELALGLTGMSGARGPSSFVPDRSSPTRRS